MTIVVLLINVLGMTIVAIYSHAFMSAAYVSHETCHLTNIIISLISTISSAWASSVMILI